mgnify:CR=1 FL=1
MGRRKASLGTPVPRMPTVAPGPKAHSGLASGRSQRASAACRGPQPPVASVDAWRLMGRGRLHFPMLPRQLLLPDKKGWHPPQGFHCSPFVLLQIPFSFYSENLQIRQSHPKSATNGHR